MAGTVMKFEGDEWNTQELEFDWRYLQLASKDRIPIMIFPKNWNTFQNDDIKIMLDRLDFKLKLKTHC
jgi:hypothetical protein